MEPLLAAALERQNQLLERIAIALERMPANYAPNYQAPLDSFSTYDWSEIGAEVTAQDADGPTIVSVNRVQYIRQASVDPVSPALWFSRRLDPNDAAETPPERLITFNLMSAAAEPLPESVKRGVAAQPDPDPTPPDAPETPPPSPQPAPVSPPASPPPASPPPVSPPPEPAVAQTNGKLAQSDANLVNQNQLKRLWAIANEHHWTKPGVHLLLREGYQLDSSKYIQHDQYEQICSQLSTVPATPYNTKAAASDPKANLRRLRGLTHILGLNGKAGDTLIKQILAEKHPGKKSTELRPPEVEAVRDALLIHYGQQQFPEDWKSIVAAQYLELVSDLGAVEDAELAYRWMDTFSELLTSVK